MSAENQNTEIQIADYKRKELKAGILHIGVGRFHRAHQAYFTDLALDKSFADWGIVGVSLNSSQQIDILKQQDGLYHLRMHDKQGYRVRQIQCLIDFCFYKDESEKFFEYIKSESIKIVSLTITEKGYHYDSNTRRLNESSELIQFDLQNKENPKTAIGVLALGLWKRYQEGKAPLTIISCDNIQKNGELLRAVTMEFVRQAYKDNEFIGWLQDQVSFPSSMVDRIVPAMTAEQINKFNEELNVKDKTPIDTEEFCQWVIEDKFKAGRPEWEHVGVQIVNSVDAYEKMKLSLLNATHSFLAYYGSIKGYKYVSQAIVDPEILSDIETLFAAELPNYINAPKDFDLPKYCKSLIERYKNPELKHKLLQIAMDGSIKIPQRWLPSLEYNLANDKPLAKISKALAAWYLFCQLAQDQEWTLEDPNADKIFKALSESEEIISFYRQLGLVLSVKQLSHGPLQISLQEEYKKIQGA